MVYKCTYDVKYLISQSNNSEEFFQRLLDRYLDQLKNINDFFFDLAIDWRPVRGLPRLSP